MTKQQAEGMLSSRAVARMIGVHVKTLAAWRQDEGRGPEPFFRISERAVRYPVEAVERFLAERRQVGARKDAQPADPQFGTAPIGDQEDDGSDFEVPSVDDGDMTP